MTIQEFAAKHNLAALKDGCGDLVIPGWQYAKGRRRVEYQAHIFDGFKDGRLGLYLGFETAREWNGTKEKLLTFGLTLKQDGQTDGTLLFDPTNESQASLAITAALVRRQDREQPVAA